MNGITRAIAEALDDGYLMGAPPGCEESDRPIVEATLCKGCGEPMRYLAFRRYRRDDYGVFRFNYRAYAVCDDCDIAEEF